MDSVTTPTPTNPLIVSIEEHGGFTPFLYAHASAAKDHYTQLLDGEKDEAVRIHLLNERLKAESVLKLAR